MLTPAGGVLQRVHQGALLIVLATDARKRLAVPIEARRDESRKEQRFLLVVVVEVRKVLKKRDEPLQIEAIHRDAGIDGSRRTFRMRRASDESVGALQPEIEVRPSRPCLFLQT